MLMFIDQHFIFGKKIRFYLGYIATPIRYLADQPPHIIAFFQEEFGNYQKLLTENAQLKKKNLILEAKTMRFQAILAENQRLRTLLHAGQQLPGKVMIVTIMSTNMAPYTQKILISAGANKQAHVGQPVLGANGVLGQITQVGPFSSQVLLISDPSSAVPVFDTRSGLRLLAVGTGTNMLSLKSATNSADIKVGDLMSTSGLGNRYPANYPVCRVTKIQKQVGASFANIACKPTGSLDNYRQVLLLWPRKERSTSSTSPHQQQQQPS